MAIDGINIQPASETPVAAYRPIIFTVSPTGTNPVAYCDIYFNGIFYKSIAKSQLVEVDGNMVYLFDIQDAAQEFLGKFIGPNGAGAIITADPLVLSCFCKFRGSSIDTEGFVLPEEPIPVQGTGNTSPVAGGGDTTSGTFYIVNSTLQHEDNQVLVSHLSFWRLRGVWDSATYPLTHRPDNYKLCPTDSDYYPLLSQLVPDSLVLHYRPKGSPDFVDSTGETVCVPIGAINPSLPNAVVGTFYNVGIPLSGSGPFAILASVAPAWMTEPFIDGNFVFFQGTPTDGDAATHVQVSVSVTNCDGDATANFTKFIDVISCTAVSFGAAIMPDAIAGQPYSFSVPIGGSSPFNIGIDGFTVPAWLTPPTIVGSNLVFTGTPTDDDVGTGVSISVTVTNCSGTQTATYNDTIDVLPSNNFVATAAYNFKINNITGSNVPSPSIFPTLINNQKKGHHTGLSGTYTVDVSGTIVTLTKFTVYVAGVVVACWQMGSTIGTVFTNVTHDFTVTAAENENVIFAIEQGGC